MPARGASRIEKRPLRVTPYNAPYTVRIEHEEIRMRKRIGLITICPEEDYQQRIMDGIFKQCAKYDYDVVVVTPLVQVANFYKDYVDAELNIYELINFELFDGVIITPIPMTEDRIDSVVDHLLEKFRKECNKPVVSAGLAFGDYPVVTTDDDEGFVELARHLIVDHDCKDIAVLTGMKDYPLSQIRIEAVRREMAAHGLELDEDRIFYGNFWYDSGEKLAADILEGRVARPEAVICGNDAMAIGLVNALVAGGIRVPADIRVTGYDARPTAALNETSVTSYTPDDIKAGAECVNYLRKQLDPDLEVLPAESGARKNLKKGRTCGCPEDTAYVRAKMVDSLYLLNNESHHLLRNECTDIGSLMESYTAEIFTSTDTPEHCVQKIYESKYLLQPYGHFYICLMADWLDLDSERMSGFSERMNMVLKADMVNNLHGYDYHVFFGDNARVFDTRDMLPQLADEESEPQVYYFVPLHFQKAPLGYAVLQNPLSLKFKIGIVFRNYIRNINNALEMTRAKNRIANLSEHDMMTGLLNRRGMDLRLKKLEEAAPEGASYLCYVIDMDGLKLINDNYGHSAGDGGITLVADAARSITGIKELCVRGGGDEFYVIGVGEYTKEEAEARMKRFRDYIRKSNKLAELPAPITASIGYSIGKVGAEGGCKKVLDEADVNMYLDKRTKKGRR